jgi:hypothetical protein
MSRRAAAIPADTWPPRMLADMAAGYVGEKHVEDFLERVGTMYPQPRTIDSRRRKFWYRTDLDKAIGLNAASTGLGEKFAAKVREKRSD